jgi:hypothetical protein
VTIAVTCYSRLRGADLCLIDEILTPKDVADPFHWHLVRWGSDNKIKVINRMVYGYRVDDFFLKIRAAFPGDR